jgi:hypothetical protein
MTTYKEQQLNHSKIAVYKMKSFLVQVGSLVKLRIFFHIIWIGSHNEMLWVYKVVCVCMYFPASIITFMCNVTFSNASFKFPKVKPSLIVLEKNGMIMRAIKQMKYLQPPLFFLLLHTLVTTDTLAYKFLLYKFSSNI